MRCNFVACFVLGLATVVYTAPVDGLASMASLETRRVPVVFEFVNQQHAAKAVPSRFSLSFTSSKAVKDQAAEMTAQNTVKELFEALNLKSQLKPGFVFGGTSEEAKGRIDFVASNVHGFDGDCEGWAIPGRNGALTGPRVTSKGEETHVISVENGQVKGS